MKPEPLAILPDFLEEGWPSMELFRAELEPELRRLGAAVEDLRPPFRKRLARMPGVRPIADRLTNRFWDYPRAVRERGGGFRFFYIPDHSYAHLVHELPRGAKSVVHCHDLDALFPLKNPRSSPMHRWIAERILSGMRKADTLLYTTPFVAGEIRRSGLFPNARLVRANCGLAPEFRPVGSAAREKIILNVGSCIPRKRVEAALEIFAGIHFRDPEYRFIQVGGKFTPGQRALIERLGISARVEQLWLERQSDVARYYQRAALVVQPSESEGFGLPVAEALACGARVICSDLEPYREWAEGAALLLATRDSAEWIARANAWLSDPSSGPDPGKAGLQNFTWPNCARAVMGALRELGYP